MAGIITNATVNHISTTLSPVGVAIAVATNSTVQVAIAAAAGAQWTGSRAALIVCVIMVLVMVPVLIVFRKPIGSILKPLPEKCRAKFRLRKIKSCFLRIFCCSSCGADSRYQGLTEAPEVLTVTLIGADEIKTNKNFYVQIWTEPQEAAPRASNTHAQANQGALSLGMERLELDWFGDEEKLIVQVVEFPQPGGDKPLGDVQLTRERILQYAREASASKSDVQAGSRRFDVVKLNPDQVKYRKRGLTSPDPVNIMTSFMLTKAQDKVGLGIAVDEDESQRLRRENELLKHENNALKTQLTTGGSVTPALKAESIMKLVLKFDISARNSGAEQVNVMSFKDALEDGP